MGEVMNYRIICDYEELNNFIKFLPELKDNETFYFSLLARDKYIRELGIGTFHSDKHQCARWISDDVSRLPVKLKQLESVKGSYSLKGTEIPQEALASYVTINPRCQIKATKRLLHRTADIITGNETRVNVYQEALTAIHKSISRKVYVDVDFDGPTPEDVIPTMKDMINLNCVSILLTRGGFHALIRLDAIEDKYIKSWYRNITSIPRADIVGDNMIPIPGTYQGGWVPRLYSANYYI